MIEESDTEDVPDSLPEEYDIRVIDPTDGEVTIL